MSEPTIRRNKNNRPNTSRDTSTLGANGRPRLREVVSWDAVNNQIMRDAIVTVTNAGAAIMLSRTSDGGSLSISVLNGDDRIKEYPRNSDEAEQTLRWLIDMFTGD